jgi:hypothetical protein
MPSVGTRCKQFLPVGLPLGLPVGGTSLTILDPLTILDRFLVDNLDRLDRREPAFHAESNLRATLTELRIEN